MSWDSYACACGVSFTTTDDLDAHYLASMGIAGTPDSVDWTDPEICRPDATPGIDGKQHYEVPCDA